MTIAFLNTISALLVIAAAYFAYRQYWRLQAFLEGEKLQLASIACAIRILEDERASDGARRFAGKLAMMAMDSDSLYWLAKNQKRIAELTKGESSSFNPSEIKEVNGVFSMVVTLCMFYHAKFGRYFIRSFREHLRKHAFEPRLPKEQAAAISKETLCDTRTDKPKASRVSERIEKEILFAVA